MFTSQTSRPLNLLAPPWMLWRAFWPPSSQRCFLQVSVLDPAADLAGPRPDYGTCHSDFGTGIPFFCGPYKGCWCRSAPCAAVCLTANYLHGGPYGRRRALLAQKPFVLCTAIRGCPPGLGISHTHFGLVTGPASMQALL